MQNIALNLSYLGTNYHGWQRQNSVITVQETLEHALSTICGEKIAVAGCGRTDAGVHAKTYCANFRSATGIPLNKLPFAINAHLPKDISVSAATFASDEFNAISHCRKKEYTYQIFNCPIRDPFLAKTSYFYPAKLDVEKMKQAALAFVGTHDFKVMRNEGSQTKTTVRTVYDYQVERKEGNVIRLRVSADGFLYNMARTMAGTLVYIGLGKIAVEDIAHLLKTGNRKQAGPTLPPEGLALTKLWYDGAVGDMMSMNH